MSDLSPVDAEILDFEALWWSHPGNKEQAIRDRWALSPTAYYARLAALLRNRRPRRTPLTVHRLQRRVASRRRAG